MAALVSITLLVYPRCRFVRLAFRAISCTSAMMELMPCALTPAYGVTSMSFRPGCHRPFHRSACIRSLLLLSWVSLLFIVWFLSFLLLPPSTICFSMSSLQPSSLSDPSPCIYPAGAYCFFCGRSGNRTRDDKQMR